MARDGGLDQGSTKIAQRRRGGGPQRAGCRCNPAAQKVEHYEIAGYGSVRTSARVLGIKDVQKLLQETLDEEELPDRKLTAAAINLDAAERDVEMVGGREKTK